MFAKIPQRLTAPFGILGDEAKLAFRSQPGGIAKLASTRNIPDADSYWNQYVELFDSPSDVFSLISPHDIRRALLEAPENIATLIRVMCMRLFNLVSDHTFPTPPAGAVSAFATTLYKTGTGFAPSRNATKEVLNCVRVLTRVIPVVSEVEGESNTFENEVLWKVVEVDDEQQHGVAEEGGDAGGSSQFVIEDEDDSEGEGPSKPHAPPAKSTEKKKRKVPSLGERLFSCITDLLFCCGFSLPTKIQVDHHKINYIIWEKGVGSTTVPGQSPPAHDTHKTEVLRLVLVLLSRQIYVPPGSLLSCPAPATLYIVQKMPRRDVLTILCSLLNTALGLGGGGIGLSAIAGRLPYNHLVFKGEDPRSSLIGICFQVLCVLLDFQSGSARDKVTGTGDKQTSAPTTSTNTFRYFLAKLHRPQDFAFIVDGFTGIMAREMASLSNVLPGARKPIPYVPDTVIFFWKMIELNKKFRLYVLESEHSMDIVAYILCYALEIKDKPQQHGLCRALSYIIQTLSAEPAFGQRLNNPVKAQLPTRWNSTGTGADFMIHAVYSMVATTSGSLTSLYPALIIALSNSAPFFKNLSVTASTRLLQMFTSFSNPLFLLSDEGHPRLLFFMLEAFNAVMLHNLHDNPNLVYAILVAHRTFEELGTFNLARGLREIRRVQLAKEEQTQDKVDKGKSKDSGDNADEQAHEEKARLLQSEGAAQLEALEEGAAPRTEDSEQVEASTTRPLTSPTSEHMPGRAVSPSEKARGKMPASRRSMSVDMSGSLERLAAGGVGRNGFVPTQEWVTSWQQGLPLDTSMLVISELLPKVQELQAARHKPNPTSAIIDFLGAVDLKHVLPPSPPLTPRRFIWSDASIVWLTSLIWGEIYVRGMTPLGIWNSTNVRLFYVKHAQAQQPQLAAAMSNVVGGLGGLLSRNDSSQNTRQRQERA